MLLIQTKSNLSYQLIISIVKQSTIKQMFMNLLVNILSGLLPYEYYWLIVITLFYFYIINIYIYLPLRYNYRVIYY